MKKEKVIPVKNYIKLSLIFIITWHDIYFNRILYYSTVNTTESDGINSV